jgi:hypothetical protein
MRPSRRIQDSAIDLDQQHPGIDAGCDKDHQYSNGQHVEPIEIRSPQQHRAGYCDDRHGDAVKAHHPTRTTAVLRSNAPGVRPLQRDQREQRGNRQDENFAAQKSQRLSRYQGQRRDDQNQEQHRQGLEPAIGHPTQRQNSRLIHRHRNEEQSRECRRRTQLPEEKIAPVRHLDVEPEVHDIALAHDVFLALQTQLADFAGAALAAIGDVVVVGDDLGTDEAAFEVGMNHSGGLRRG